jgi:hypothetical protein
VPEAENDRQTHRDLILPLAGFSFAGMLALNVFDAKVEINLQIPAYYLLVGFSCYFLAANIQGYKYLAWHNNIGDALYEIGCLCLFLPVAAILLITKGDGLYPSVIAGACLIVPLIDHFFRVMILYSDLSMSYLDDGEIRRSKPEGRRRHGRQRTKATQST